MSRVRLILTQTAAVAALLLSAGSVVAAIVWARTDRPAPLGDDAISAPVTRPTTDAAPAPTAEPGFDAWTRFADFGWLPDGLARTATTIRPGLAGGYTIEAGAGLDLVAGPHVTVTLFPPGTAPHPACPGSGAEAPEPEGTPLAAENVGGRPATWTPTATSGRLRWQYAANAWAEADGDALDEADVRHIATDLRTGGTAPLRFPFTVSGIDRSTRLAVVGVTERSPSGWSSYLMFGAGTCTGTPSMIRISVGYVATLGGGPDYRNARVDGHRAYLQHSTVGGVTLSVFDVPGLDVTVDATDAAATRAMGDPFALYRSVTVLGTIPVLSGPPDTSTWTDTPLIR
jgi:hypothetical protein